MKTTKIYDWPTRLFHWSFVGTFLGAFFIAKVIDDESPSYSFHMLLGLILAATVILRVIWGLIGSKYARFSSFALNPKDLLQYFKDLFSGRTFRRLGHNPASSWAAVTMMALALGLAVSGYLMTTGGNKEVIEEVHELFANTFIIVAIAHVAGVILHMLRHKDRIGLSMLHGRKQSIEGEVGITHTHFGVGVIYVMVLGAFIFHLNKNYDRTTRNLNLFGSTLNLGEHEEEGHSGENQTGGDHDDDGHHDRDDD